MNFELNNKYLGNWLAQLNGKTVDKIYKINFTGDNYSTWIFLTFKEYGKFLEIESDFDGSHIKINLTNISELEKKLNENNLKDHPDLYRVYIVDTTEALGQLINKRIDKIEYGIDKDRFVINEDSIQGRKGVFTFIQFYLADTTLTIFEGGSGLAVSDDKNIRLDFEDTFDRYRTK